MSVYNIITHMIFTHETLIYGFAGGQDFYALN